MLCSGSPLDGPVGVFGVLIVSGSWAQTVDGGAIDNIGLVIGEIRTAMREIVSIILKMSRMTTSDVEFIIVKSRAFDKLREYANVFDRLDRTGMQSDSWSNSGLPVTARRALKL